MEPDQDLSKVSLCLALEQGDNVGDGAWMEAYQHRLVNSQFGGAAGTSVVAGAREDGSVLEEGEETDGCGGERCGLDVPAGRASAERARVRAEEMGAEVQRAE